MAMLLRASVGLVFSAWMTLSVPSARADMASWPEGCFSPYPNLENLQFEYDTSDLAAVHGIDTPRLTKSLARAAVKYRGPGALAIPVGSASGSAGAERVLIIVTLFPLAANPGTERLVSRDSGSGLGIIQPDLSRWLTNDGGIMVLRSKGPADEDVNLARNKATCIRQSVAKVGLIECGTEHLSPNSTHIRAIFAIGLSPVVDVRDDGSPYTFVASSDYLDKAVADCLDFLTGL